ncbi:MAG: PadR family transcriptional regulator [Oscillospiraceae bacterium]
MDERLEKLISTYLPMSEQSFLLLLCLLTPAHGYKIMQTIGEKSNGRILMGPSTVYTLLYKMEQDGLIKVSKEVERRKVYEITDFGLGVLLAENSRLKALVEVSDQLLAKEKNSDKVGV